MISVMPKALTAVPSRNIGILTNNGFLFIMHTSLNLTNVSALWKKCGNNNNKKFLVQNKIFVTIYDSILPEWKCQYMICLMKGYKKGTAAYEAAVPV